MSILDFTIEGNKQTSSFDVYTKGTDKMGQEIKVKAQSDLNASYNPTDEEKKVRQEIVRHFTLGYNTMNTPRREFNDLSVLNRMSVDQMAFNTYQPNNGQSYQGDIVNSWRSNAIRPIVRNKAISVAAHATAHMIFPKIFAQNEASEEQLEAAQVMEDLMEFAADETDYDMLSLYAVIGALVNPASFVYTDYAETYINQKRDKDDNGKWIVQKELCEELSGFQDQVIPVDELYIENFYESNIQKQGWLIWRKVQSYSLMKMKYESTYENFQYVKPGVQLIFNDANNSFYNVYDTNLRGELCEEVIYWNKGADVKLILVNGVMLTECDNPNPRNDKQYPIAKFGYEPIDEGRCFYYKSLAFKLQQDANIVNTLYQMIIDGTYLNLMPPMINVGGEAITNDVIVPGAVTTLSSPDADLRAVKLSENLSAGMTTLTQVEQSVSESSSTQPIVSGHKETAYSMSIIQQEAQTMLGPFVKMISSFVKKFGELRVSDILQYMTILDATKITGSEDKEAVYKTFLIPNKLSAGKSKTRKIHFDSSLPTGKISEDDKMQLSMDTLKHEGGKATGESGDREIFRVNPEIFRELEFSCVVTPDIMKPKSDELEKAYLLEEYDRAIQNPLLDQEQVTKDFLLAAYPKSKQNVDKYIKKQEAPGAPTDAMDAMKQQMSQNALQPGQGVQQGQPQGVPQSMAPAQPIQQGAQPR